MLVSQQQEQSKEKFKGKIIGRTRFGDPSITSLIQKTYFYKLFNSEHSYLFKLISTRNSGYVTCSMQNISFFETRHTF